MTFNTTSSFLTNTNWQYYGGETTMSYFSQMAGLTVQNFLSAGVGIAVAVALIRGIIGRSGKSIGNFWQDLIRTVLWVLIPLSFVVALVLVFQGSIQNFSHYLNFNGPTGLANQIAMGPVASQEAIKELGTNGGGFFNTNSAHPFENPTGFTNFVEMLSVLIIPAALVFMYGRMARNRRQGYAIYATMAVMFLGAAWWRISPRRTVRPRSTRPVSTPRCSPDRAGATWRARSSGSGSPAPRCSTS